MMTKVGLLSEMTNFICQNSENNSENSAKQQKSGTNANGLTFAFSTQSAKSKEKIPNERITTFDLERMIKNIPSHIQKPKLECERLTTLFYQTNDKEYYNLSNIEKDKLNYFIGSGFCKKGHDNASLEYNGCVQIDIDCKYSLGDKAAKAIKELIVKKMLEGELKHYVFCAISPRNYGVKCLVSTDNILIERHKQVIENLKSELDELLEVLKLSYQFDYLAPSQPCYIPYDTDAFFNHITIPYHYNHVELKRTPKQINNNEYVSSLKSVNYDGQNIVIDSYHKLEMLEGIVKNRNKYNDSRNCFVFQLAQAAKEYGINYNDIQSFCISNFAQNDFCQSEINRVLNNAFKTSAKTQYYDYQLLKYAKNLNVYIPQIVLDWKSSYRKPFAKTEKTNIVPLKPIITEFLGSKDEFFFDILRRYNYELSVENFTNRIWIVPTGSGKTYTIGKFAEKHYTIIVCPTNGLTDMVQKYGAKVFRGDKNDIRDVLGAKFMATNYASFVTLCSQLKENQHLLTDVLKVEIFGLKVKIETLQNDIDFLKEHSKLQIAIENDVILKSNLLEINELETKYYIGSLKSDATERIIKLREKAASRLRRLKEKTIFKMLEGEKIESKIKSFEGKTVEMLEGELSILKNQLSDKQLILSDLRDNDILKKYNVFVDECHNFVANANKGYQLKDLERILGWRNHFNSFSGVTGTFLKCEALNLPVITVKIPSNPIKMTLIECQNIRESLIESVKNSVGGKRFPIVLFNNTGNELEKVRTSLTDLEGIEYFNAHQKENSVYQNLIKSGQINDECKGIITTSVLKEGIDIATDKDFDLYFAGSFHSSTLKQFIARIRNKAAQMRLNVYILRGEIDINNCKSFDYELEKTNLDYRANKACEMLNLTVFEMQDAFICDLETSLLQKFEYLPIHFNDATCKYEIRELLRDNFLYELETTRENANIELLKFNLAKLDIELVAKSENSFAVLDESKIKEYSKAITILKEKELSEYETILSELNNNLDATNIISKKSKNNKLTKTAKKVYKTLENVQKLGYLDAQSAVLDMKRFVSQPNDKPIKEFLGKVKTYVLRNNDNYMSKNSIIAIQIKAFISEFDGKSFTSNEIKEKVVNIMSLNKAVNLEVYKDEIRPIKSLAVLDLFFETKRGQKRFGDEKINFFKFDLLKLNIENQLITNSELDECFRINDLSELVTIEMIGNNKMTTKTKDGQTLAVRFE